MPFTTAGQLVQDAPTALENDTLGLVAENLRASHYSTIAVLDRVLPVEGEYGAAARKPKNFVPPRILGLIEECDLSRATLSVLNAIPARVTAVFPGESTLAPGESTPAPPDVVINDLSQSNGHSSNGVLRNGSTPVSVTALTARDVMKTDFGFVPAMFSLHNALLTLDRYDASALPVMDSEGHFRGLISRADIVAALGAQIRPPSVGGMATPLGVWLTDGRLQGGAPPLGLFLSGLVLSGCFAFAHLAMLFGLAAINRDWATLFYSGRVGINAEGGSLFNLLATGAQGLLFLLALRLTPMAGIHAAEHQTVWAIERGLALTPENVAQMPRAHPRCGTNLMALVGLVTIWLQHLPSFSSGWILFSLIFTFFFWRNFGTALQEHLTTRPASPKQLASGIKAGRELMEKYQGQQRGVTPPLVFRLLNSGMLLAFAGVMLGTFAFNVLLVFGARLIFGAG